MPLNHGDVVSRHSLATGPQQSRAGTDVARPFTDRVLGQSPDRVASQGHNSSDEDASSIQLQRPGSKELLTRATLQYSERRCIDQDTREHVTLH